jgi:hypothetical protein
MDKIIVLNNPLEPMHINGLGVERESEAWSGKSDGALRFPVRIDLRSES